MVAFLAPCVSPSTLLTHREIVILPSIVELWLITKDLESEGIWTIMDLKVKVCSVELFMGLAGVKIEFL